MSGSVRKCQEVSVRSETRDTDTGHETVDWRRSVVDLDTMSRVPVLPVSPCLISHVPWPSDVDAGTHVSCFVFCVPFLVSHIPRPISRVPCHMSRHMSRAGPGFRWCDLTVSACGMFGMFDTFGLFGMYMPGACGIFGVCPV